MFNSLTNFKNNKNYFKNLLVWLYSIFIHCFLLTLILGQCPGISEVGNGYTGYDSSTYLMIEEMDLDVPVTDDVIPHPQETVFNTKLFYGDEVSGDDDVVYR